MYSLCSFHVYIVVSVVDVVVVMKVVLVVVVVVVVVVIVILVVDDDFQEVQEELSPIAINIKSRPVAFLSVLH